MILAEAELVELVERVARELAAVEREAWQRVGAPFVPVEWEAKGDGERAGWRQRASSALSMPSDAERDAPAPATPRQDQ